MTVELKLADGTVVRFDGADSGEDASRRYADLHRNAVVVAWREVRHGLFVGSAGIIG